MANASRAEQLASLRAERDRLRALRARNTSLAVAENIALELTEINRLIYVTARKAQ